MIKQLAAHIRTLISPPCCAACKARMVDHAPTLCDLCVHAITPVVSHTLHLTKKKKMRIYAASTYAGPLKKLILRKHHHDAHASRHVARIMWRTSIAPHILCDVMVPIPLHWTRAIVRGFNQADEMAQELARAKRCNVEHLLRRNRYTRLQARLSKNERRTNVSKAFSLAVAEKDLHTYTGKHILLIDDLTTTGSTLREAAHALLPLRPASINALVACRAI